MFMKREKKKRTCQVPGKWQRQSHLLTALKEGALSTETMRKTFKGELEVNWVLKGGTESVAAILNSNGIVIVTVSTAIPVTQERVGNLYYS